MNIRPFAAADADAVVSLWQVCGLVVAWNDPRKDIARKLAVNPEMFLVGAVGGEVMASVMVGYEGHRGWVNYLAVAPAWRGQGHARRLMQAAEAMLVARGCPKLNVQVRATNQQAVAFYQRLGYAPDHAVGMGKRLIPDR